MKISNHKIRFYLSSFIIIFALFFVSYLNVFADLQGLLKNYTSTLNTTSDAVERSKIGAKIDMVERQIAVDEAFKNLKDRLDAMSKEDPRHKGAAAAYDAAKKSVNDFLIEDPENDLSTTEPYVSADKFNQFESAANEAINAVNSALLAPTNPGNVPNPDLMTDFIPWLIRNLFRFASLGILVAFIVSGVMFVIAFGNDQRTTAAKHILYYTLIGFVFIALAFAIVKAVTNIDFFGFI